MNVYGSLTRSLSLSLSLTLSLSLHVSFSLSLSHLILPSQTMPITLACSLEPDNEIDPSYVNESVAFVVTSGDAFDLTVTYSIIFSGKTHPHT